MGFDETRPHLFVMRIWVEPGEAAPRLSRGLIEHIPSGERHYFRDLGEIHAFVSSRLSRSDGTPEGQPDAA